MIRFRRRQGSADRAEVGQPTSAEEDDAISLYWDLLPRLGFGLSYQINRLLDAKADGRYLIDRIEDDDAETDSRNGFLDGEECYGHEFNV